jgi:hypothetical protein
VQLPVREMAQAMVERAIAPEADLTASEHEIVFTPTHLIERESVAAPPADGAAPGAAAKAKARPIGRQR